VLHYVVFRRHFHHRFTLTDGLRSRSWLFHFFRHYPQRAVRLMPQLAMLMHDLRSTRDQLSIACTLYCDRRLLSASCRSTSRGRTWVGLRRPSRMSTERCRLSAARTKAASADDRVQRGSSPSTLDRWASGGPVCIATSESAVVRAATWRLVHADRSGSKDASCPRPFSCHGKHAAICHDSALVNVFPRP
jgi:hypothetical protein